MEFVDLEVLFGRQRGMTFYVDKNPTVVGRDPDCDLQLEDECSSRRHARIIFAEDQCFIEDLDSASGIYVNDRLRTTCRLKHGDTIRIGRTRLLARPSNIEQAIKVFDQRFKESNDRYQRYEYGLCLVEALASKGESQRIQVVLCRILEDLHDKTYAQIPCVSDLAKLANVLLKGALYHEAIPSFQECVDIKQGEKYPSSEAPVEIASIQFRLGWALLGAGRVEEAELKFIPSHGVIEDQASSFNADSQAWNYFRYTLMEELPEVIRLFRAQGESAKGENLKTKFDRWLSSFS